MKYQYSDSVQVTPHFNSAEFRCKCGKEHEFSVSDELVQKLEQLYAALNCSKIIVTSGFRCTAHDKTVGGSGTGQHTLGNAADICCYGQDGQPISSKVVCCKAQDIGFRGIANITAAYQYTHVDVRPNGKWYGDEVHGNSTVTDDFYKYFGGEDMKGIDVSVHNGNIDWQKVKNAGIPLMAYPIKNSTMTNGIVLDPFLGSGSTLIACCETDRVCRGIDLDPKFVDVIVKRYLAWCREKQTAEVAYVLRDGQKLSYEEAIAAMPQDGDNEH